MILVTGGAGYVGAKVVAALARRAPDRDLLVLDPAPTKDLPPRARHLAASLSPQVVRDLAGDVTAVVHLAALTTMAGERDPAAAWRLNLVGFLDLLEALARPERPPRVVLASTLAAMPRDEAGSDFVPTTSYGASKRAAELLLLDLSRHGLVDGRILRLPTIIVRRVRVGRGGGGFISDLVRRAAAGEPFACPAPLDHRIPVCSVEAAAEALAALALDEVPGIGAERLLEMPSLTVTPRETAALLERLGIAGAVAGLSEAIEPDIRAMVEAWPAALPGSPALRAFADPSLEAILAAYLASR
ncbi:MAG TPA: NAD-dependent epimerase/dehydratase family protein [Beijerinckiaceae bacterium]|nr:NAD-dependent epimerase/dehydratase family protein [Beijerinckiaceae bacterium]